MVETNSAAAVSLIDEWTTLTTDWIKHDLMFEGHDGSLELFDVFVTNAVERQLDREWQSAQHLQ